MTHLLLVDPSPVESASLLSLEGCEVVTADELAAMLEDAPQRIGASVDAVVLGARTSGPLLLVQRLHRAAPRAGVVVCTSEESERDVRRALSYTPDVPASIRVVPQSDPDLPRVVGEVAESARRERRHEELLVAVATQPMPATHQAHSHASLGALLDHAPFGVVLGDLDEKLVTWNRRAEDMLDLAGNAAGQGVPGLFSEPEPLIRAFQLARADRLTDAYTALTLDPDGSPIEVSAVPTQLEDGSRAVLVLLQDVSARRLAERSRDRLAAQVGLLAEVSEALAGTLDGDAALQRLATQVVPTLGDWVSVQIYDARGNTRRVAVHHREPRLTALAKRAQDELHLLGSQEVPSRRIARGEGPITMTSITPDMLRDLVPDAQMRSVVEQLGVASVIAVPLPGRDGVLGSMVLVNGPGTASFTPQDVAVAQEVGRRAGVALETIGLYRRQRDLAEGLQRSLLSRPVEPDHSEITVRYVAAAQEAQVGGDWYDAFLQPDGSTVLVIGDVIGHDTRAAAAMGQLRGLLRGIGYTTGTGPAEMLGRLDAAIEGLDISTSATAVVARVEQGVEDRAAGLARMRWSNAGHPPPVVVRPGHPPVLLDSETSNLLLGVLARTPRDEHEVTLGPGATLLLYTDGLVERRGQDLDEGLGRLLAVVEELRDLPLEELCDQLLSRMSEGDLDDDVALVALRRRPAP